MSKAADESPVRILGPDGTALPPSRRAMGLAGNRYVPFDAADVSSQHMAGWRPMLWSPDGELNLYRDRIVARVRDAVRNDGWASGAVTRILDNAIGSTLRPASKPDWRWLARETGLAFDHEWAREFGAVVDAHWNTWANDTAFYCDATRNSSFSQMAHTGFRHGLVDGDALAFLPFLKERLGIGKARYATCVQLIDPDRLSNPYNTFDTAFMRGGVEIDRHGAAVAYHIRKAHVGDWWAAADSMSWERIPRETEWGRPNMVHYFESSRAGAHRGGAGIFTPILQRLKMLVQYDSSELDAAIINAIFSAYVESPMDPQLVKEAMGADESFDRTSFKGYQEERALWHQEHTLTLGGARMPHLFPGEAIKTVTAARPSTNFPAFEDAMLRNIAAGLGLSAQQVSNNWSNVNYSSARSAALEAYKTLDRRQREFFTSFATPIRTAIMEEMVWVDDIPMPVGIERLNYLQFAAWRTALCRCFWVGPPKGWVNPIDERAGEILGMESGMGTLESACIAQGTDWEENLHQRAYEISMFDKLGIPRPQWAGMFTSMQQGRGGGNDNGQPNKPDEPERPI